MVNSKGDLPENKKLDQNQAKFWLSNSIKIQFKKGNNLNYEIFLNEFLTYFGKYHDLIHAISQTMLKIHLKICHNFKVYIIWLEVGLMNNSKMAKMNCRKIKITKVVSCDY